MRLLVVTTICLLGLTSSAQPPIPSTPPEPLRPSKGPSKIIIIRDGDTTITMKEPGQMRLNRKMFRKESLDEQLRKIEEGRLLFRMPNFEKPEENKALLGVVTEKDEKGARIVEVNAGTPAEKCGLQKDDIITAINGNSITDPENLYKEVGKYQPTDKINIDFLRNGEVKTTTTKLAPNLPVERTMPERIQDLNLPFLRDGELRDLLDRAGGPKPNLGLTLTDTEKARGVQVEAVKDNTP
ncbi:MAG: PDZ domain-containing protein, partial [Sediminibacterium sp.]